MADGRTKPLAEIRPGDRIYGTVQVDQYRRYAATTVLDHWSTIKPAYRVVLEDGTEIVCSGDHRFWTARAKWKHVTGAECGRLRRPHLTLNDKLMGVGRVRRAGRTHNAEYRRGLSLRDDSWRRHLGSRDVRPAEREELDASTCSDSLSLTSKRCAVHVRTSRRSRSRPRSFSSPQPQATTRRSTRSARSGATASRRFELPSGSRGGRARTGARGSSPASSMPRAATGTTASFASRTPTRSSSTGPQRYLRELGFDVVVEDRHLENGLKCVRIRGGICEHLRFFHTVDPAISRKRSIEGAMIKSNARASGRRDRAARRRAPALRHHHRNRGLHLQRRHQPQLLRPPHAHVPRLQCRP